MGRSPVSTLGVWLPSIVQVPVCTSMQVLEGVCFSCGELPWWGISEVSFCVFWKRWAHKTGVHGCVPPRVSAYISGWMCVLAYCLWLRKCQLLPAVQITGPVTEIRVLGRTGKMVCHTPTATPTPAHCLIEKPRIRLS